MGKYLYEKYYDGSKESWIIYKITEFRVGFQLDRIISNISPNNDPKFIYEKSLESLVKKWNMGYPQYQILSENDLDDLKVKLL